MHREILLPAEGETLAGLLAAQELCFNTTSDRSIVFHARVDEQWAVRRGDVIGGYGVYHCGLHMLGRDVPMGGIAAVAVVPEARGQGIARGMMAAALDKLREQGRPIAGLYASTWSLYRQVGFEQAGTRVARKIRTDAIRAERSGLPVRRVSEAELRALVRPRHGNLVRSDGLWTRLLQPVTGKVHCYVVGDGEGWAVLWQEAPGPWYTWVVRDWGWSTPAAAHRLWGLLAEASTMATEAQWYGAPDDVMETLLVNRGARVTDVERWMIRIVDVPTALEARGWAADGEVVVDIEDDGMPDNAGAWTITVRDGQASVTRGGAAQARLHIRALASIYTGFHTAAQLQSVGRVEGDTRALDALFAAPAPWMADHF